MKWKEKKITVGAALVDGPLSSRLDAVASRVQSDITMRTVSGSMTRVIKYMDKAVQSMNLEWSLCL